MKKTTAKAGSPTGSTDHGYAGRVEPPEITAPAGLSIDFAKALELSCDTFFYRVGLSFWERFGSDPKEWFRDGESAARVMIQQMREIDGGFPWHPVDECDVAADMGAFEQGHPVRRVPGLLEGWGRSDYVER